MAMAGFFQHVAHIFRTHRIQNPPAHSLTSSYLVLNLPCSPRHATLKIKPAENKANKITKGQTRKETMEERGEWGRHAREQEQRTSQNRTKNNKINANINDDTSLPDYTFCIQSGT